MRGQLKCKPSASGAASIAAGRSYFLHADEREAECLTIRELHRHHDRMIVALGGVDSVDAARLYVGRELFVERDGVALRPNEYLDRDLIGLELVDSLGSSLGSVRRVEHYPAQDCLVVQPADALVPRDALVPLVREFVRTIDLERRQISVTLPRGLLDTAQADEA